MKPDRELERVLRSGSLEERETFLRKMPPEQLLHLLPLIVRRHRRRMNWAMMCCVLWAWNCAGGLPRQLSKWMDIGGYSVLISILQILFGIGILWMGLSYFGKQSWRRDGVRRRVLNILVDLVTEADTRSIGASCAALWSVCGIIGSIQTTIVDRNLIPLLLHLDDDEVRKLPEDARCWIRWRLKRGGSPEFRVAGLLALSSGGDKKIAPVARGLRNDSDERVRLAADEALAILETRRG